MPLQQAQSPPPRLLLVEDLDFFANLVCKILTNFSSKPFEVVEAHTLQETLELLARQSYDLILLDLNLPDSKGMATLSSVREASPQTPVVVLTGNRAENLDEQAFRLGAADFLYKDELHPSLLPRLLGVTIERSQTLRQLRMSEAQNQRLIVHAEDVIYRIDARGRITFINPAVKRVTGYSPEEMLGQSFLHWIPDESRQAVLEHYQRQLAKKTPSTYLEVPLRTKSGRMCWVGQHVWFIDSKEPGLGFEAIARDITDLRQAMADLEGSRQLLEERVEQRTRELEHARLVWELTFNAVPELVLITDTGGRVVQVNQAVAERAGKPAEELTGPQCNSILPWLDDVLSRTPDGKESFTRQVSDKDRNADYLISTSPLTDEYGRRLGQVHVARDVTRLKQAERTVKQQLRFMQDLIDAIPNPVYFKDTDGLYTGFNTAYLDHVGHTAEQLMGKDVGAVLPPELAEQFRENDRRLMKEGGIQAFESHVVLQGERHYDSINRKAVLRDADGKMLGLVGVIQDITELRAAERALRASEEQFRSLFEQAPISLWEEDFSLLKTHLDELVREGVRDLNAYFQEYPRKLARCASLVKVLNVNTYTLELFEADDKEQLLSNLGKVFTRESLPAFRQQLVAMYGGSRSISLAGYNCTITGRMLYVGINLNLTPGCEDTWERVLVSVQDLTERMKAETAIRESEKRYRTLVEALNEGLLQVDENAIIRFCNNRFLEMTDYTKEELYDKSIFGLLDEANGEKLKNQFAKRKAGASAPYELSIMAKSGQQVDALISPRALFDAQGIFRGSFSLITDITERKKLEQQLRQSQKMEAIGQLAAGIAHEINTPTQYVTSNSGFLQEAFVDLAELAKMSMVFLENRAEDPGQAEKAAVLRNMAEEIDLDFLLDEIPKALEANMEGLERIAVIVRSMRDFAHPGREEKQPADLNQIIENTMTVARNEWKYVAEVETDLDPALPLVTCDANEIKQVILNMVVNAAQAISEVVTEGQDEKGRIAISSRSDGRHVVITIADTGPGIPPELAERIFDPFFTTKEPGKGTGQGLALAYRAVVDNHGGALELDSEPGKGAVFQIRLPLKGEGPGGEY